MTYRSLSIIGIAFAAATASAQQLPPTYPANGQNANQQQADKSA